MTREQTSTAIGPLLALALAAAACGASSQAPQMAQSQAPSTPQHSAGVDWQQPRLVDSGEARRGPWRMNRSDWRYIDDPTTAINEQGHVAVAWVDQVRQDVLFQLYGPDGEARFEQPVGVLGESQEFSWLPRLVLLDGDDPEQLGVHLLWQEIVFSGGSHGGEIFFARSTDGGATWSEPQNLSDTTAGAGKGRLTAERWDNGSYDLAAGARDELFAAWTEYEGHLWFSRSGDGGRTFSQPLRIAGGGDEPPARGPSIATDGERRVHIAWTVGETGDADIHLATSDDGGATFGAPRAVHERPGHADAPKLALDGSGRLHLVYAESPDGPFQRYQLRYARADGAALHFSEPRELSAPRGFASAHAPMLRLDGDDALHLTFELLRDHRGRSTALAFTRSTDGGETFETPSVVTDTGDPPRGFHGSLQGLLMSKLAVNAAGELALVNSTYHEGQASRVWLLRGRRSAEAQ